MDNLSLPFVPHLLTTITPPLLLPHRQFSKTQNVDYLTGRVWIGFWLMVIVIITVAFEGSLLVRYISPFTQEIFAFLISIIFIYETFHNLYEVFEENPLLKTYPPIPQVNTNLSHQLIQSDQQMQPNTALLSLVMMVGTFFIAYFMRKFRNSRFLGGKVSMWNGDLEATALGVDGMEACVVLLKMWEVRVTAGVPSDFTCEKCT
eukprot:g35895.t1